jgi:hypothetical protein
VLIAEKAVAWLGNWLSRRYLASAVESDKSAEEENEYAQIYQIYYSEETRKLLDEGFIPLDNSRNLRPDWREYFPIRNYLLTTELDERCHYGFLSPRFKEKTFLDSEKVISFIKNNSDADVLSFSPGTDLQALFLNSFLQGDYSHPGLLECTAKFFAGIGIDVDLNQIVMDSSNTIFCNYFVAKPKFWRAWLDINEQLYSLTEKPSALSNELNALTPNRPNEKISIKVFIMERVASFLLATDASWTTKSYNPFAMSKSDVKPFCDHLETAIICDALKIAYRDKGHDQYITSYKKQLSQHITPQCKKCSFTNSLCIWFNSTESRCDCEFPCSKLHKIS